MSTSKKLVALVTGASGGFGYHLAKSFLAHDYNVLAASRSITSQSMQELESLGATLLKLDPNASPDEIKGIITNVAIPAHGKVDILVNNAGFLIQGALEEFSPAEVETIYRVNVFSPVYITNALLPSMRARRSGLIMHISSCAAHNTVAGGGLYSATKSALSMLSLGQRAELAPLNIEVVTIEPGYFRTSLLAQTGEMKGRIADYEASVNREALNNANGNQNGDPAKGSKVLVEDVVGKWVRSGCKVGSLGTARIPLGSDAGFWIKEGLRETFQAVDIWHETVSKTDI